MRIGENITPYECNEHNTFDKELIVHMFFGFEIGMKLPHVLIAEGSNSKQDDIIVVGILYPIGFGI